jgi:D-aspartate ligase
VTSPPVLVLNLYYHGGIGVVRTLGRLGVPVYAIHHDRTVPAACSRHLREVLEWNLEAEPNADSLEFVLQAGRRLSERPVLIAADDTAQGFVDRNAAALRDAFRFPDQPPGLTSRLYDKRGLHELCSEHGVPAPRTSFPETREQAREQLADAVFPVILKPLEVVRFRKRTGIAMYIASDASDAMAAYDRLEDPDAPNIMLQEYIPGPSSSVWVFTGYFDAESELVFGAGGVKRRQYPIHTGTTCFGEVRSNAEMEGVTARFVKALGYRGVFDCGYRYDAGDGIYKLLDVNPRVGANFRQCVGRDGLDVVRAMYLDLTGQPVPRDEPAEGRTWWVENYDLAAAAGLWREGSLPLRRWLASLSGVDEPAWFDRRDLAPFRALVRDSARAALRRIRPGASVPEVPAPPNLAAVPQSLNGRAPADAELPSAEQR